MSCHMTVTNSTTADTNSYTDPTASNVTIDTNPSFFPSTSNQLNRFPLPARLGGLVAYLRHVLLL